MRRLLIGLAALSCLLAAPRRAMSAGEYVDVPLNSIFDVSADGSLLLGRNDSNPDDTFLWSEAKGSQRVPGRFYAASDDGQFVVGGRTLRRILLPASENSPGFYLDADLGDLPGGAAFTSASSISDNAAVVVGGSNVDDFGIDSYLGREAFRWTQASGIHSLGDLAGEGQWSHAIDVSADGQVIVGIANIRRVAEPSGNLVRFQPFRWTEETGMVGLGYLDHPGEYGGASAVSADGNVIVGQSNGRAYRWTSDTGMVDITPPETASPSGANYGAAYAASADGRIVLLNAGAASSEYLWDPIFGPRRIDHFVQSQGLVMQTSIPGAQFISQDGRLIYGTQTNLASWAWGIRLDDYWPAELLMGDINVDSTVDLSDFGILKANFGVGVFRYQGDLNGDHRVDLSDFGLLKDNFGTRLPATQPAPEPPAWTLAAIGVGLLTLRLRRWAKLG